MLRIDIDDRLNHNSGCSVCCCEPISLRAGEKRLITLNYAPWTVPIMSNGGDGLQNATEISVTEDASSCHNAAIDGFAPPSTNGLYFIANQDIVINAPLTFNLLTDMSPAGNTWEFSLWPVSGPYHGSLTATPLNGNSWIYQPDQNFKGYDQFWVKIKDGQGRVIIRPVNINVGGETLPPPAGWGQNAAMGVQIDRNEVKVNKQLQTLRFPIYLPPSNDAETIDACRRYRITVKAYARDCDSEYSHITCLDVTSGKC